MTTGIPSAWKRRAMRSAAAFDLLYAGVGMPTGESAVNGFLLGSNATKLET
jgi:hypothetical protein